MVGEKKEMVHRCLAKARHSIASMQIKKSGYNSFNKFHYYELDDILPVVDKAFFENGLISYFSVDMTNEGALIKVSAKLEIVCMEDGSSKEFCNSFLTGDLSPSKGANVLQTVGATNTYMKRYLYMNAVELSEHDMTDSGYASNSAGNGVNDDKLRSIITMARCEMDINNILASRSSSMPEADKKLLHDKASSLNLEWNSEEKRYKSKQVA